MSIFRRHIKHVARALGLHIRRYRVHLEPIRFLVNVAHREGVDLLLDVGANKGQFAREVREAGYSGCIVSFEPLADEHLLLQSAARRDKNWEIAPRMAVGAVAGNTTINVSKNRWSSSLLPMLPRHSDAAPSSIYVGQEEVPVIRLDDYLERSPKANGPIALKIDAQGFEGHILEGAARSMNRVSLIFLEMSLAPLYEGAMSFLDLFGYIHGLGFRCVAISPGFVDPRTSEMLQVDGLFLRDS